MYSYCKDCGRPIKDCVCSQDEVFNALSKPLQYEEEEDKECNECFNCARKKGKPCIKD